MDEARYEQLVAEVFDRLVLLFEQVDVDQADVEPTGDVIRITYAGGEVVVVNTQRPTRQVWLAGGGRGWHFDYDAEGDRWVDDRGNGEELVATVVELSRRAGVELDPS